MGRTALAEGGPEPYPVDSIAISVVDNGPQSILNTDRLLAAVAIPERDPELYQLLGRSERARRSFNLDLRGTDWEDDFLKLAEVTKHYVTLTYRPGTDLNLIERQLQENRAFAFAGIDQPGHYSATPTDIYFAYPGSSPPLNYLLNDYQWASQAWITNLQAAWDWNKGWAHVGLIDGGTPNHLDSTLLWEHSMTIDHMDLQRLVTVNHSYNLMTPNPYYAPHGTHVLGLIGSNANNSPNGPLIGGVGACWSCSIQYYVSGPQGQTAVDGAFYLSNQGAQVINLSGGYDPFDMQANFPTSGIPCSATPSVFDLPFCQALAYMKFREVVFVAAAGNSRHSSVQISTTTYPGVQFPASEPSAIAIGGIDSTGAIWDDAAQGSPWGFDPFDQMIDPDYGKCPDPNIFGPTFQLQTQCGSNYSDNSVELDFVAPARKVISTVPLGNSQSPFPTFYFEDRNFNLANDGFSYATGTSMASPIFAGIVALLRSANPLITRDDIYTTLKATASNNGIYNGGVGTASNKKAWGTPNAGAAIALVQGKVNGAVVKNRLTPMFMAQNNDFGDLHYTTRPQVILGANDGSYLSGSEAYPDPSTPSQYSTNITIYSASSVTAYPYYPGTKKQVHYPEWTPFPVATFWVFTSDTSMWNKFPSIMKPLYRMSFNEHCTRDRRHSYPITQTEIDSYAGVDQCSPPTINGRYRKTFHFDGIEGYILSQCPPGFGCDNFSDPSEPQALYRRYSTTAGIQGMSALILAGEVSSPDLASFTSPEPGMITEFLGYVFPNIDTDGDGLPDGLERLYSLNRFSTDSDGDGCLDGIEFPVAGVQQVGKDPLVIGSCP